MAKHSDDTFLDLYLHATGRTMVPRLFHTWGCLSLIAACLANRVWYEKFPHKKLHPNLYTILIGPSGLGKGEAIDFATGLVPDSEYEEAVHPYRGKVSGAGFSDHLAEPPRDDNGRVEFDPERQPIIYLITPELSAQLGEKKIADDFIKRMTDMYTGGKHIQRERTRGNGASAYRAPVINWLAGTTLKWMHESVSRSAIESGFFGRAMPIEVEDYDLTHRITDPSYPSDYPTAIAELRRRVRRMSVLEGRFDLSNQARDVRDAWFQGRPVPSDPAELPSWIRADDLALKLAMVLSVSSGREDFLVTSKHMSGAITFASQAHRAIPHLLQTASQTPQTTALDIVNEFIKLAERIPHSALLKKVAHRGIHAKELAIHVDTLCQQKLVQRERSENGGAVYVWAPRTRQVFAD